MAKKHDIRDAFRNAVFKRAGYSCQGPGCTFKSTKAKAEDESADAGAGADEDANEEQDAAIAELLYEREVLTQTVAALAAACRRVVSPAAAAPFRFPLPALGEEAEGEGEGEGGAGGAGGKNNDETIPASTYLLLYRLNYAESRLREVDAELEEAFGPPAAPGGGDAAGGAAGRAATQFARLAVKAWMSLVWGCSADAGPLAMALAGLAAIALAWACCAGFALAANSALASAMARLLAASMTACVFALTSL
jgi:hypothetical protein